MVDARWSLIVHGGARTIGSSQVGANRRGCLIAAEAGAAILRRGGSALDAAEYAVRMLEDDPTFNAGSGSVPTRDGAIEMDAAMMDGETLEVGAVAAIRDVRNPVSVARLLLKEVPVLLVGKGANAFADEKDIPREDVPAAIGHGDQHDTVGCVAFDAQGRIAAATSTGGLSGQRAGRVGDAPIPGCGFYADSHAGGVAISGDGESIMRILLAGRVMEQLNVSSPQAAAALALRHMDRVGGEAGIIALNDEGAFGLAHNSDHFAIGLAASWLPAPRSGVHQSDFKDLI